MSQNTPSWVFLLSERRLKICAYATLAQAQSEAKVQESTVNGNAPEVIELDRYLLSALHFITKRIDQICQQEFAPRRSTRYFDLRPDMAVDVYLNSLVLDKPLLDVSAVKIADFLLTEWAPPFTYNQRTDFDYFLYPVNDTPHYKLQATKFLPNWSVFWYASPFSWLPQATQQACSIDGLWGYRKYYDQEAWESSTQVVGNSPSLSATETVVDVTTASVFSPGMWIRFADQLNAADDEIAEVVDTNVPMGAITIARGGDAGRGTTVIAHATDCPMDIFLPEPNIVRACLRWADYLYARRAVYETMKITAGGMGSVTQVFPQDIPEEAKGILGAYINWQFVRG